MYVNALDFSLLHKHVCDIMVTDPKDGENISKELYLVFEFDNRLGMPPGGGFSYF